MTRDDIIRMAREAGFRAGHIELYNSDPMPFVAPCSATDCLPELVRFAAIVAAAEREACKAEVETLRAKIEEMEKQEPAGWIGLGPRDGRIEFSTHRPAPSVMRDFNVKPLYLAPGAKGEIK